VSWNDAQSYITWLNQKTGLTGRSDRYRLPTEAEWEYAARAETTSAYWWGDEASKQYANYPDNTVWSNLGRTTPVGAYPANPFGLHDMHGNVWEWVEDCYESNYSVQPSDGSAFTGNSCFYRVVRGGAFNHLESVRSADRAWSGPADRSGGIGFRIARTLP
jgi:formylglycine-generating enzyme required for sulfatase activity